MDATGMYTFTEILERFRRRGIRVVLVEIQDRLSRTLARAQVLELVGQGNVFPDLPSAIRAIGGGELAPVSSD
jgi:MFS superfamily sulfate permease-like transporter